MLPLGKIVYEIKFFFWFAVKYWYFYLCSKKSKEEMDKIKAKRLNRIVKFAVKNSLYYKNLYKVVDIGNIDLKQLPVINKTALTENFDDLIIVDKISRKELEQYFVQPFSFQKKYLDKFLAFHTSGSTGNPTYVIWGPKEFATATIMLLEKNIGLLSGNNIRELIGKNKKFLYFGIMDDYVGGNSWVYEMKKFVNVKMVSIFSTPEKWVEIINDFQPEVIMAKPHVLAELACQQEAGNLNITPEKLIFVGEMLRSRDETVIKRNFKCNLNNSYSTCETGPVAFQVNGMEALNIIDEEIIVELLDEDNEPINEYYKTGRIVITNLYSRIMPIIRYDIGDSACYIPNGVNNEFTVISYIQGRKTSNFIFENSQGKLEKISEYPFWSLDFPGIARYQVIQETWTKLLIKVEWEKDFSNKEEAQKKLERKIKRIFEEHEYLNNIDIQIENIEHIKPGKSGKIKITFPLKE